MSTNFLSDARLYAFLLQADLDLAQKARQEHCPYCGDALHSAHFRRKPRGNMADVPADFNQRFSFSCAADACRRRTTPPSVRFLGPKVHLLVVVALVTAMRQGPTARSASALQRELGVSRRTLARWKIWWLECFPRSKFWLGVQAQFGDVALGELPLSLITRFEATTAVEKLCALLRFLAPLGTRWGLSRPS